MGIMKKKLFDYFESLSDSSLPRENGVLLVDNDRVKLSNAEYSKPNCIIDGTPYFTKEQRGVCTVMEYATSAMYNKLGIPTPPSHIIKTTKDTNPYLSATKSLFSLNDFIFEMAQSAAKTKDIIYYKCINDTRWGILYDQELKERFLRYMTPECYEQLCNLYLVDELRSEADRHENNYFFYKSPTSEKFEGIIPIDNELCQLFLTNYETHTKDGFEKFLREKYFSFTPVCSLDILSHQYRIDTLKKVVDDQVLSNNQISLLKKAVAHNFPGEVKKTCELLLGKLNNSCDRYTTFGQPTEESKTLSAAYDATSRLWEYNYQELGTHLGL